MDQMRSWFVEEWLNEDTKVLAPGFQEYISVRDLYRSTGISGAFQSVPDKLAYEASFKVPKAIQTRQTSSNHSKNMIKKGGRLLGKRREQISSKLGDLGGTTSNLFKYDDMSMKRRAGSRNEDTKRRPKNEDTGMKRKPKHEDTKKKKQDDLSLKRRASIPMRAANAMQGVVRSPVSRMLGGHHKDKVSPPPFFADSSDENMLSESSARKTRRRGSLSHSVVSLPQGGGSVPYYASSHSQNASSHSQYASSHSQNASSHSQNTSSHSQNASSHSHNASSHSHNNKHTSSLLKSFKHLEVHRSDEFEEEEDGFQGDLGKGRDETYDLMVDALRDMERASFSLKVLYASYISSIYYFRTSLVYTTFSHILYIHLLYILLSHISCIYYFLSSLVFTFLHLLYILTYIPKVFNSHRIHYIPTLTYPCDTLTLPSSIHNTITHSNIHLTSKST